MMFESVLEPFATQMHTKGWETGAFRYPSALFWGTELPTNVFTRTHPIARMNVKRWETGAFRYLNALFCGTEFPRNVFARTHQIASIRPKKMFGCVLEHFPTRMPAKPWETDAFRYLNALFRGTELPTNVFAWTQPIASIRPKIMFGSFWEDFTTRIHSKRREAGVFRYSSALFRGTPLPTNVFTRTDPIASIRPKMIFESALEHFTTLTLAKQWETSAFWYRVHCYGVPHFKRTFSHEHTQIACIGPEMMFGSVLECFTT